MKQVFCLLQVAIIMCIAPKVIAQCNAPISASASTTISYCINNGSISIHNTTGGTPGSLPEFAITASSNPLQPLVAYQNDSNFHNIYPGTYTVSIRYNCGGSNYSSAFNQTATVAGNYQGISTSFSNIRSSFCNNGAFTVNASNGYTGISGSYTYQLVSAQGAVQPDPNAVTPVQTSNIFDSLAAGTYYVRVFDDCGNFITSNVSVPQGTISSAFFTPYCGGSPFFQYQYGCDSAHYTYTPSFFINGNPSSLPYPVKFITIFPDSTRDTAVVTSAFPSYDITSYINNNQLGPFYHTLIDACGNISTSVKWFLDTTQSFSMTTSNNFACDSFRETPLYLAYCSSCPSFTGNNTYSAQPRLNTSATIGNYNFEYSTDSGATWHAPNTTVGIPYGVPYRYYIRICNKVYIECLERGPVQQQPFLPMPHEDNVFACNGNSGLFIDWSTAGLSLYDIRIDFSEVPAGQPALPPLSLVGSIFSDPNSRTNYLFNLVPGKYVYTATDTVCGRTYTDSIVLTHPHNYTVNAIPQQGCSQGNIEVNISNSWYDYAFSAWGYWNKFYIVNLIDQSTGTVAGTQTVDAYPPGGTAIFNNLPVGTYNVAVIHDTAWERPVDLCPVTDTVVLSTPAVMDLSASLFLTCGGTAGSIAITATGGLGPYTYELYNGAVAPANLITTQTSPLFTGLNTSQTYTVRVIDNCGTGVSVSKSFAPFSGTISLTGNACPGNALTLSTDTVAGASYSWTKDGISLQDTLNSYTIDTLVAADYGTYVVTVSIPGCADFTISRAITAATCTALPLELLSFDAAKNNSNVQLEWKTAQEQNTSYFEVQHSINGSNWDLIGKVNAFNNGTLVNDYHFTHNNPAAGTNYYKLKMVDKDGSFHYSSVRTVSFTGQGTVTLYPNPATDVLYINTTAASTLNVSLYAANGSIIKQYNGLPAKSSIDIKALPRGIYYIRITCDNMTTMQQIVKR